MYTLLSPASRKEILRSDATQLWQSGETGDAKPQADHLVTSTVLIRFRKKAK